VVDIHQDDSVLELFEVRRILEPAAVMLAARRAQPSDVEHLLGLLAQVHAATSVDDLVAHDRVFHRYVAELTGNAYLVGILETVSSSTLRARVWRGLTEEGAVERTLTEHRAIVDALGNGDAALAAAQATVHIDGVARWLRR
jgi:GntR family transcriptional regulator, transcriptional repressor for pyruvate dehydrogenase complex